LRLVAGSWFVLREKYCWLVADKPNEQAACLVVRGGYSMAESSYQLGIV
jgi:hypothetical protein